MRLLRQLRNQWMVILVDTGSTHNFMDDSVVTRSQLPIQKMEQIQVKVASGEKISSEGRCTDVNFKVQGNIFVTKFCILSLVGCDAVLRIQWLRNFVPILWDFLKLTMEFSYMGRTTILKGLNPIGTT